jgi:hypothetical protein
MNNCLLILGLTVAYLVAFLDPIYRPGGMALCPRYMRDQSGTAEPRIF